MTTFSTEIRLNNPTYESREEGIQAAYSSTSQEWKDTALAVTLNIAQKQSYLSADDVVRVLSTIPELETSYGGLTGLLKLASEEKKWIEVARCSCGEEKKHCISQRISNHGREILVYRSLVFGV